MLDKIALGALPMVNKAIKQQNTSMNNEGFLPWEGKRCFHVAVVGTMSSGKSTLIDALLGTDCMPSGNMACTASSDETGGGS